MNKKVLIEEKALKISMMGDFMQVKAALSQAAREVYKNTD